MTLSFFLKPHYGGQGFSGMPQVIPTESQLKKKEVKETKEVKEQVLEPEVKKRRLVQKIPTIQEVKERIDGRDFREAIKVIGEIEDDLKKIREAEQAQLLILDILDLNDKMCGMQKCLVQFEEDLQKLKAEITRMDDDALFLLLI